MEPSPWARFISRFKGKAALAKASWPPVLAQYLREKGKEVRCIDTDPVNRTFAQYGALGADRLNLRDEHNRIEQRAFDSLIERFLTEDDATFVVDNGASTFLPLWHYLLENNALDYLRQNGRRVYVHTVITGGQALLDTLNGFHELAQTTAERNIVVWVNEYFGRVEAEGKKFSEMAAYRENSEKVCGAVIFSKAESGHLWPRRRRDDRRQADVQRGDQHSETPDHGEAAPEDRAAGSLRATRPGAVLKWARH